MVVKGKRQTLKQQWQKVKSEFEGMDRSQKWEHFWAYYWWTLVVLALFVMIVSIIISGIISSGQKSIFAGTVLNMPVSAEGRHHIQEGFLEKVKTADNQTVGYSFRNFVDPYSTTERTYALDVHEDVTSMIQMGELDYMIYDGVAQSYFMNPSYLSDLREIFTEEELAVMGSAVIKLYMEDTKELVPVAINIRDTEFAHKYVASPGDYYISFIYKELKDSNNRELCRKFWQHLKGGQTELLQTRLVGCAADVKLDGHTMNAALFSALDCAVGDERTELVPVSFSATKEQTETTAKKVKENTFADLKAGKTDYLLCGKATLDELNKEDLLDLRLFYAKDELARMELLYSDDGVPVAIKLSAKEFGKTLGVKEDLWLVFSANTSRMEDCGIAAQCFLPKK